MKPLRMLFALLSAIASLLTFAQPVPAAPSDPISPPPGYAPTGAVDDPKHWTVAQGLIPVAGWAKVAGSTINRVEIWIDGVKRGDATYGYSRPDVGGNYGYRWDWNTVPYGDGHHTIQVWAYATNGQITALPFSSYNELPASWSGDRTKVTLEVSNTVSLYSFNFPDHAIRHRNFVGELSYKPDPEADRYFRLVPGLADSSAVSLESVNFPGHYLRHKDFKLYLEQGSDGDLQTLVLVYYIDYRHS